MSGPRRVGFKFVSSQADVAALSEAFMRGDNIDMLASSEKKPRHRRPTRLNNTRMSVSGEDDDSSSSASGSSDPGNSSKSASEDESTRIVYKKQRNTLFDTSLKEKFPDDRCYTVKSPVRDDDWMNNTSGKEEEDDSGDNQDHPLYDDDDDATSVSHEFDADAYACDMYNRGFEVLCPGRGCNHRSHCPRDCAFYHDYRTGTHKRHHYYNERGSACYRRCIYGRYVAEPFTGYLIRLDSEEEEGDMVPEKQPIGRTTTGWHHTQDCPLSCTRYHYKDELHVDRYARSRDNGFHPAPGGRWIKDHTTRGPVYVRLGPNDEEDYDYEQEPHLRLSATRPPIEPVPLLQHHCYYNRSPRELVFHQATSEELLVYLKRNIKNEDTALIELVKQLCTLQHAPVPGQANLLRVLTAGVPGTGKTTLASVLLRRLFGMQKGGPNEPCFITCRLGNYSDDSHANRVAGTGPGYIGFGVPSLLDDFRRALGHIRATRTAGDEEEHGPRVIFLLMDEVCKTTNKVLDAFNSLSSDGILEGGAPDAKFELPDDVFLLIYGTSNFGSIEIGALTRPSLTDGRQLALQAMRSASAMRDTPVTECNIRRLGTLIPFFAIEREAAVQTIFERCRQDETDPAIPLTAKSHYITSLGRCATMSDHELHRFIEYCVNGTYVKTQGITACIEFVLQQLDYNRVAHNDSVRNYVRQHSHGVVVVVAASAADPVMSFHIIDCAGERQMTRDVLLAKYPVMGDVMRHTLKAPDVVTCLENGWPIAYIAMTYAPYGLCSVNIISPLLPTEYQHTLLEQERLLPPPPPPQVLPQLPEHRLSSPRPAPRPPTDSVIASGKKKFQIRKISLSLSSSSSSSNDDDDDDDDHEIETHEWHRDDSLSNRKTPIYVCFCRGRKKPHYKRRCSAGKKCVGRGIRYAVSRGYCRKCLAK